MPKFLDGYSTTLGSRVNTDKLKIALGESIVKDKLLASSLDVKKIRDLYPVFITGLHDSEEKIELFAHPFYFRLHGGEKVLATDMRLYMRKNTYDGYLSSLEKSISNRIDFNFARSRAILNLEWIEGDVDAMKVQLWFSTMMFSRWIADILNKAFALDPRDQIIVSIVSCYYYQSLFTDAVEYDEDTIHKWVIHTTKSVNVDKELVEEIFKKMPQMKGIESLIEGIRIATENVRLDKLNLLTLLTLLKHSWFGTNATQLISAAVEHPPTWMAIIFAALSERTFRQSLIFKIADRIGKRGVADEYVRNYLAIVSEHNITESHQELARAGLV